MKYHIHIPKLLEFALNVVCDDVTLRGKQCLISPIPYPLYLRCIMTYADKYGKNGYSTYRLYRDIRRKVDVSVRIGRLYPNVLDHVVLDDDDIYSELIIQVAQSHLVDEAVASIHRFASRCLASDKSVILVKAISRVLMNSKPFPKLITDVILFYGAKLDPNLRDFFTRACLRGLIDIVKQCVENRHDVREHDMNAAVSSGNCETIKLVHGAYRGRIEPLYPMDLFYATVQLMELLLSLGLIQRGKRYEFSNIPSFSVLQWILDHDVMEHDEILIDIAFHASRYSGHYFDMLRYLIEQRNFTVPRDILVKLELRQAKDLGVFDYVIQHGADVNAVVRYGKNVLEHSPMFIRYWIDKGFVLKSNDVKIMTQCIESGMTAPALEMMIDKYSVRLVGTALQEACLCNNYEVVEMLIRHGADVNIRDLDGETPYDYTHNDRIKQLLIQHGCEPNL